MSESAHFYTPEGTRVPDVLNKSQTKKQGFDVYKNPDIGDAKRAGSVWRASVTTMIKIMDKPELRTYHANQAITAALSAPKRGSESEKDYYKKIRIEAGQHAKQARDEGSEIHAAIYNFLNDSVIDPKYVLILDAIQEKLKELVPDNQMDDWVSEHEFATEEYGGSIDLHHRRARIFMDWKTTGEIEKGHTPYDETLWQLAAYSKAINITDGVANESDSIPNRCICGTISREKSDDGVYLGKVSFHEYKPEEIETGYTLFQHIKEIYYTRKKYRPL